MNKRRGAWISTNEIIKEGDIVSLDIGFIRMVSMVTAYTYAIGEVGEEVKRLLGYQGIVVHRYWKGQAGETG